MDDFDELKRKKEYLELQREVAKLERNNRINKVFNFLPYWVTVPLLLIGLSLVVAGMSNLHRTDGLSTIVFGLIVTVPFFLKFFSNKS